MFVSVRIGRSLPLTVAAIMLGCSLPSGLMGQNQWFAPTAANVAYVNAGVIAAGDFNQDLYPDLFLFDGVLVNDGQARFEAGNRIAAPLLVYPDIQGSEAFDIDGDSDLDLLVGSGMNGVQLLVNDGTGSLAAGGALPALPFSGGAFASFFSAVDTADVDGDGDLDIFGGLLGACGAFNECAVPPVLLLNDGAGNFTVAPGALPPLSFIARKVRFLDFDADGDQDVVISAIGDTFAGGANSITVLSNDGFGSFARAVLPANVPLPSARGFTVGRFNADAYPDIFVSGGFGEAVLLGGPAGLSLGFSVPRVFIGSTVPHLVGALDLLALDVNGDLVEEVAYSNAQGTFILTATAAGMAAPPVQALPLQILVPVEIDCDLDGNQDLILRQRRLEVYLNPGDAGPLVPAHTHCDVLPGSIVAGLGDSDQDGDLDIIAIDPGSFSLYTSANDGFGRFTPQLGTTALLPSGVGYRSHVFDGDNDGDVDLFRGLPLYGSLSPSPFSEYWENQGGGNWIQRASLAGTADVRSIASRDLDNDGDLDLVVARSAGLTAREPLVIMNLGGNSFAPPVALPATIRGQDVTILDADQDGDQDIVIAAGRPAPVSVNPSGNSRLFINQGAAGFVLSPILLVPSLTALAADVNGDGIEDLILDDQVYLGGVGGLSPGSVIASALAIPSTSHPKTPVDIDGDGDIDLISNNQSLFLNNGNGVFAQFVVGQYRNYGFLPALSSGDLDQDGDVDFISQDTPHVLWNLSRHLEAPWEVRLGRPAALDINGPASSPFLLFVAQNPAAVPAGSFGSIFIEAATAQLVGNGFLSTTGRARLEGIIPNIPSLAGATLHWQAWVTDSPRFTSLVTTTFLPW